MESASPDDLLFASQRRTLIRVTGADRVSFLHNLCTNDVRQLEMGGGCEAFFTNVQGKILAHVFLFCTQDALLIDTVADQADILLPHLDKYLIREDVQLTDESDQAHLWLRAAPTALPGIEIPQAMYAHQSLQLQGHAILLRRVPLASPTCSLLTCAPESLDELTQFLSANRFCPATEARCEELRLHAQFPNYGRDITSENLPQEVDRDRQAISFTKGCYLGQETVARIDAVGHVNRYVAALHWDSPLKLPESGLELFAEDKAVGTVTSVAAGQAASLTMGLGIVRREYTEGATLASAAGPVVVKRCDGK